MNKSGIVSKACIAHHYWHNMDDPKYFFKIMIGDFKNGVTIPKKFVANIKEKISEHVTLEVPDGKTYTVEVAEEQQNELVLRSGWAEFASAYELEPGDFLVFTNSGNSHFTVRIFDPSCCEKEISCVPLDSIPCTQERKCSHGKQLQSPTGKRLAVGSPSGTNKKTPKVNSTDSPSSQKKTGHVPSSFKGVHQLGDEQRSKVEEKVGAIQSETPKMNPIDSPSQKKSIHQEPINSGASQKLIKSCIDLPTGWSMTSEQEAKVISLEQKIQPKIPFYITAMHETSVASGILAIKKKYASKHLVDENGTIQLCQLDGRQVWPISLDITADDRCAVSKGWMGFIRYNKLQEGDICIFQPSKSKEGVKLIFLLLVQNCRLQSPGYVPSAKSPRHGAAKPPYMLPRHTSLTDERKSNVEEKVGAIQSETPKLKPIDSPSQKKSIHEEPINSGASQKLIKACIDLPTGWSMTSAQEAKVISLEQKIQPKDPFYITAMHKKSMASGILAIKKKYACKHLVDKNGTIQLCQLDGRKVWPISLDITADDRCAVSKGWMGFIRHNKLQEGDICIFQPSKSKEGVKLMFHPLVQNCCLQPRGYVRSAKSPRHRAAKPPYMLPQRTSLTDEQRSKVEEKLRGIQSEIPVYVTVIENTNVKRDIHSLCILEFGLEYATEYLPGGDKSQLSMRLRCPGRSKDDECEPEFRVKRRRHQIGGEGWRKFVTDNKLKPDDICLFNLRNTKTLTMDVHIIQ